MRLRLAAALHLALLAYGPALAEPVGWVARLQGEASADAVTLATGGAIEPGALLRTGTQARLEVRFMDGTMLTLGERAVLRVEDFVYDPAAARGNVALALADGAFLVVSGAVAKLPGKPLKVTSPLASIGIRGTTFWGGSLDNPLDVLVLDGAVVVTSGGGQVELKAGEGTALHSRDDAPEAASRWAKPKIDRALGSINFN